MHECRHLNQVRTSNGEWHLDLGRRERAAIHTNVEDTTATLLKDKVHLVELALGRDVGLGVRVERREAVQARKQPQAADGLGLLHRDEHGARVGRDAVVLPVVERHSIRVHLTVVHQVLLLVAAVARPAVLANALRRVGCAAAMVGFGASASGWSTQGQVSKSASASVRERERERVSER